ncbi:hypothetical protein OSB04_001352 [Centaurea solstitialis]|uniref:RING-type E3 ubiquitin transferase n=1 Tax=Centaurea solstitialis TaxID=347529 RepID=A0AA38WUW7_9ASTR|nr:hypothetical protein OSB04_001352 [Centaurea solstitialis]
MDLDPYPLHIPSTPTSFYGCHYCARRIRVYFVSGPILSGGRYNSHPETLTELLRSYRSLPHPYTWYHYEEETSIVNILDLQAFQETHRHPPSYHDYQPQQQEGEEAVDDVAAILEELNMDRIMNESFQQASDHVASSGLTKKQIYKNLKVKKYRQEGEEESEICVVCQVEFEKNEKIGVLQCKHRFHPECIKDWLLRKNVCPLCKHQVSIRISNKKRGIRMVKSLLLGLQLRPSLARSVPHRYHHHTGGNTVVDEGYGAGSGTDRYPNADCRLFRYERVGENLIENGVPSKKPTSYTIDPHILLQLPLRQKDTRLFRSPVLSRGRYFYRDLPYPYTWYVYRDEAAIVNVLDLQAFLETHQWSYHDYQPQQEEEEEAVDEVAAILQDLNMDRIMNESFQQASDHVASSGLTKKQISRNLRVKTYRRKGEEESEICVVCQVEFEKKEKIGVLQCKHRFHPECIKEWLLHKNVCPLCKHRAIDV